MIHSADEKVFRFVELAVYAAAILGVSALKLLRGKGDPRFMPILFVALGAVGLVFLTRFSSTHVPSRSLIARGRSRFASRRGRSYLSESASP
ncbi:MAG: hypothetical protein NTV51_26935 [Verrucomicrobia bacterium]|nr:hypothetical protein [Verrucomicrobiota bacterium]